MSLNLDRMMLNPRVLLALAKLLRTCPPQKESVRELQFRKLKRLLIHAHDTFPFYRERMRAVGFNPRTMGEAAELQQLPVLDKAGYREFMESLRSKEPAKYAGFFRDYTSGSTGAPLTIYRSWPERANLIARWLRVLVANGYRPHHRTFSLFSPDRFRKRDSLLQTLGFMRRYSASYSLPVPELVNAYLRARPDVFYATKTMMMQMALHIRRHDIQVLQPKLYVTIAETMDKNSIETIESVFGRENRIDSYGCVELGTMAFELLEQKGVLQFCHDTHVLELENDGVVNDEYGKGIITDLDVYSMPIIRYNLGDWIQAEVRNGLKIIAEVQGRQDDWVVFADGNRCAYNPFKMALKKHPEIRQYRVIQNTVHDIEILAVTDTSVDQEALRCGLIRHLKDGIRSDVNWSVRFTDSIPPDENAKLRMIISKVRSQAS